MSEQLISFHGQQTIKDKYVFRLSEHHKMDRIIQGAYWINGRGCAVGCTLDKYDHDAYEKELGLPAWIAYLEDAIFEGFPVDKAPTFAKEFLEAVPVGVDVTPVKWQLAILRHERDLNRLQDNKEKYAQACRDAIQQVIEYCKSELSKTATAEAAKSAYSAAWMAAELAKSPNPETWNAVGLAYSAAWSAARSARSAMWDGWARLDNSAAMSAVMSAKSAMYATESNHFIWEAETLIRLLKELA